MTKRWRNVRGMNFLTDRYDHTYERYYTPTDRLTEIRADPLTYCIPGYTLSVPAACQNLNISRAPCCPLHLGGLQHTIALLYPVV